MQGQIFAPGMSENARGEQRSAISRNTRSQMSFSFVSRGASTILSASIRFESARTERSSIHYLNAPVYLSTHRHRHTPVCCLKSGASHLTLKRARHECTSAVAVRAATTTGTMLVIERARKCRTLWCACTRTTPFASSAKGRRARQRHRHCLTFLNGQVPLCAR